MTCHCDDHPFPPPLVIGAGLTDLPRQLATFAEWRDALLDGIGAEPRLVDWRGRENDLGLLLVEMAAYVLDLGAFYHAAHTHEGLLRPSRLAGSTRRLVGLLGYLPRPAVAARADLALRVDGRKPVRLPAGAAFRSVAADGAPPQVFELGAPILVEPLRSRWPLAPVVPGHFGTAGGGAETLWSLLFQPGSVTVRPGAPVLVRIAGAAQVRFVTGVDNYGGADHRTYQRMTFDSPLTLPAGTATADVTVLGSSGVAHLWARSGLATALSGTQVLLDGLHPEIAVGSAVILRRGSDVRPFTVSASTVASPTLVPSAVSALKDKDGKDAGSLTSAAILGMATQLTLDADVNSRKPSGAADWTNAVAAEIAVLHAFGPAGHLTRETRTTAAAGDTLALAGRPRQPFAPANRLMLEDVDGRGALVTGSVDFSTGAISIDPGAAWPQRPLTAPISLNGNVVAVTRGETVTGEVIGRGDATAMRLRLKLQKKPLTYLPGASPGNDWGLTSTLTVWVGGVKWTEVPSFFGVRPTDEVYVVEHDDDENTFVVLGGGARPPTGALIIADYRFGAGAKSPPPGGLHQLAKPVPGLSAVRDPVGAFGGADREPQSQLRALAPRSALLLGRAISVPDFEAAAASTPGVRAVRAEWRWSPGRQQPLVEVAFIGPAGLAPTVLERLSGMAEPSVEIDAVAAQPVAETISLQIAVDSRYAAAAVLAEVRKALIGSPEALLSPERVGVAQPLFRSVILEAVLAVPGVETVTGLRLGGAEMNDWGVTPGPAAWFDFENGKVILNGDDGHV